MTLIQQILSNHVKDARGGPQFYPINVKLFNLNFYSLEVVSHNFKWVKMIQIRSNGGNVFWNLVDTWKLVFSALHLRRHIGYFWIHSVWSCWWTAMLVVRGSNAYFSSNLESGSKVFFSVFSCYIGIVGKETAWWHSHNIEHFYITRFIKSRQSGRKIIVLHVSKNINMYLKH